MEAPKCRLCGDKHWSSEKCKAVPKEVVLKSHHVLVPEVRDGLIDELRAKVKVLETELASKPAGSSTEKRKAYMREYMKKRRAPK